MRPRPSGSSGSPRRPTAAPSSATSRPDTTSRTGSRPRRKSTPPSNNSRHPDRYQHVGKLHAEPGDCTRGQISREELRILFIEAPEVGGSSEQHLHIDDIGQRRSAGPQNALAVQNRLTSLILDGGARHLVGLRIQANDSRGIDEGAGADGLAEQRRAGCRGGSDYLSRHCRLLPCHGALCWGWPPPWVPSRRTSSNTLAGSGSRTGTTTPGNGSCVAARTPANASTSPLSSSSTAVPDGRCDRA